MPAESSTGYELLFAWPHRPGRSYVFPCDAHGQVDIDALGDRARLNYLYAHTIIGREFYAPVVCGLPVASAAR